MSSPFITGQNTSGSLRNDFGATVGFNIVVGASNISVTDIGRWVVSGNSQTHLLKIWRNSDNTVIASVTVDASLGTPGTYQYGSITPVTLVAGGSYNILSTEANGGDQWYDHHGVTPDTAFGTCPSAVYSDNNFVNIANNSYAGPNILVGAAAGNTDLTSGDSYSLSDSANENLGVVEELSDSIVITDSAIEALVGVIEQTVSDTHPGYTDSVAYDLWGVNEIDQSESFAFVDSFSLAFDIAFTFSDSITLSDLLIALFALALVKGDTLSISDSFSFYGSFDPIFFDRIILVDLVSLSAPSTSVPSDTIAISDSTKIVVSVELIVSDSIVLSDSLTPNFAVLILLIVGDTIVLGDSTSKTISTSDNNYIRNYLNDVNGIRTPETISTPADEDPGELNEYLRRYLNDVI